jgi:hypothetical protein
VQLTFYPYRKNLSFVFEHPLNSEPLRIDVVIIKKKQGVVIDNPIGAMFRGVNILEYKSPADHLSVQNFHKVGAYARLYCVQNGVDTRDMTISFVTASYPRKLFDYLRKECRFKVSERHPGIYYVEGDIFPIQIIETKRLEGEKVGIWLKELRGGLKGEELKKIIEMSREMPKGAPLSAYLHTVLRANSSGFKEIVAMSDASFEAVLEECGLTEKWIAEGMENGIEKAVKRMQKYGMGPKQISEVLELPRRTVSRYLKVK